ncbi:AsnC family transcriptional regulator [Natranaerofaba carboxydovora]|uniref:siroheme decarboxylase subunit alpha n=1 Tax=Natranaerofaba carboxydovora TaxID=2742683 RepID=UPI001F1357D8|nr:AsnC family transcriptional regulator [Natranaerofaba carboxydovora]UMZ73209.1 AsnC-type helix-turn-helix domain protein [Natranaerofaba carboxydovora]
MDEVDKDILNTIQAEFPIDSRPFLKVADKIGISEGEVIERIKSLKDRGYIRRIGGVFDSNKLGFKSTLVALRVTPGKLEEVARKVSSYKGVTHNYQREDYFNLWFTLVAEDENKLNSILDEIESFDGVEKLLDLPALRVFKIGLNLSVK